MDNTFSSIPLFCFLRDKGIGACGTVRTSSKKFPKELNIDKRKVKYDWNTRSGIVVDSVLAMLWVDNGLVHLLTTVHQFRGDDWDVMRKRR
ncbi:hypothetical protein BC936DRAFT_145691 [Jimgerdemannia flammicorona]|uniref:PiggyBac transposable element-derived protein domain-containing protein n=1 Tax=Jimgerdemannia flammicorona TaxID=994334 RepID=A0A433D9D3_9FUNG|nr:hypothetical protein BC936DRAFT_145691 [Jimgerdemannia flammicorona]